MLNHRLKQLVSRIMGNPLLDEKAVNDIIKELQRILISSDVNVKLVLELTNRVKKKALDQKVLESVGAKEQVVKIIYEELVEIVGEGKKIEKNKARIMLLGLYGAGKTTTCAKLAKYFIKKGLTTLLIAGDFERQGAIDQLEQLAKQINSDFMKMADREELCKAFEEITHDIAILDTPGKNALENELINELKYYKERFKPDYTFLVISADTGQVAEKQAASFHEQLGIDGVIVTRVDGSGKAGGALSACHVAKVHVYFIGTGEKIGDFEEFDAKKYVGRLLGFPDIETLLRKVEEALKEDNIEIKEEDLKRLDYEVFLKQLKATKKMGPFGNVLSMLGINNLPEEVAVKSEAEMKKIEAIIYSMTPEERKNPELVRERSRQERIARGSGTKLEDVRNLVSRFRQVERMFKMLSSDRGMQRKFEQLFKGMRL